MSQKAICPRGHIWAPSTSFSLGIVCNVLVDKKEPVFFVSLEQSRIELAERLLCCQARVDSHRMREGTLNSDDMDRLSDAGGLLRNAKRRSWLSFAAGRGSMGMRTSEAQGVLCDAA